MVVLIIDCLVDLQAYGVTLALYPKGGGRSRV